MRIGIVAITCGGKELGWRLAKKLPGTRFLENELGISALFAEHWQRFDGFVCIMASGVAVRAVAPLLAGKESDPCLVVLDEKGRHAISLLSGHLGGGNVLARQVAGLIGATPVITTASDVLDLPALDLWAGELGLVAERKEALTRASARLVNTGRITIFSEVPLPPLPGGMIPVAESAEADIIVSHRITDRRPGLILRPRTLVVGIGCNRGTPVREFAEALSDLFDRAGLARQSISKLASIEAKRDENGLLEFAARNGWQIDFFSTREINDTRNVTVSAAALKAVGAIGVAEPAALLGARAKTLLIRKRKWQNVTMAVARADFQSSAPAPARLNI